MVWRKCTIELHISAADSTLILHYYFSNLSWIFCNVSFFSGCHHKKNFSWFYVDKSCKQQVYYSKYYSLHGNYIHVDNY